MSIYLPVSESKTRCLIGKLFLTIPEFLKDIAPEGLENSAYSALQTRPIEADYKTYRSHRVSDYKYNRMVVKSAHEFIGMMKPKFLKSLEDFRMTFKPFYQEYPAGIVQVFSQVIKEVFGTQCVVHSPELRSYSMNWEQHPVTFLADLVNELNILPRNYLSNYGGQYQNPSDLDLAPFYVAVFKFLKENGLNWQYRNEELCQFYFMLLGEQKDEEALKNVIDEDEAPYDETASLEEELSEYRKKEVQEHAYMRFGFNRREYSFYPIGYERAEHHKDVWGNLVPLTKLCAAQYEPLTNFPEDFCLSKSNARLFRKEIDRINKEVPDESGKLVAYYQVYGSWPKGYPVSVLDY